MKIFIILLLFLPNFLIAQDFKKLMKTAEKQFYAEEFEDALKSYNDILYISPKNSTAIYRSEICSLMTNFSDKSVDKLVSSENKLQEKDGFYNYWLGHIYKKQGKFEEAQESWTKFQNNGEYKSPLITLETQSLVDEVALVLDQKVEPINYEVETLSQSINSNKNELSPVFVKSSNSMLYFTSKGSKNNSYQLFSSGYDEGNWLEPKPISRKDEFNEKDASIGLVERADKTFIYSDLYYIENKNNEWLSKIVTAESSRESHLFMNSTETKMLFSASISGNLDNLDLFMVELDQSTGDWSEPKRLNDNINSLYDEDYPFLSSDEKTLYYSSKGQGSIGGYDIFKSEFNEATNDWSAPIKLNTPINSTGDDIQFKLIDGSNSGFFASNRNKIENGYDIYLFHDIFNVNFKGTVVDENNNPVSNALVSIYSSEHISKIKLLETNEKGVFTTLVGKNDKLNIEIKLDTDVLYSDQVAIQENGSEQVINVSKEFSVKIPKDEVVASTNIDDSNIDNNKPNRIELNKQALIPNITFDFNKHDISKSGQESLELLVKILNQYPDLNIEIAGHTDNLGSQKNNNKVAKRRANSVYKHLVAKGVKKNRLIAKGYGESKPVAPNNKEENGKNLNRRVEIKVIE